MCLSNTRVTKPAVGHGRLLVEADAGSMEPTGTLLALPKRAKMKKQKKQQ